MENEINVLLALFVWWCMKFENIKACRDEEFRRITGVKRTTFEKMLEILSCALVKRLALGDPKPKLSLADMLLACLGYIREYRTYAHVAASYPKFPCFYLP